jgi:hypothetical protein
MYVIADKFIVQWPELTERYQRAEYLGRICWDTPTKALPDPHQSTYQYDYYCIVNCHANTLLLLITFQSNGLLSERCQRMEYLGRMCWDIHTMFFEIPRWFNIFNHGINGNTIENILLHFCLVVLSQITLL